MTDAEIQANADRVHADSQAMTAAINAQTAQMKAATDAVNAQTAMQGKMLEAFSQPPGESRYSVSDLTALAGLLDTLQKAIKAP